MGDLAELQQNLLSHFATQISEQGFVPMKAPDFCKDFVIVRTKKKPTWYCARLQVNIGLFSFLILLYIFTGRLWNQKRSGNKQGLGNVFQKVFVFQKT